LKLLFESDSIKIIPSSQSKSNCNPDRIAHEDFIVCIKSYKIYNFNLEQSQKSKTSVTLERHVRTSFKAHKDSLTTLSLVDGAEKRILTSSLDCYMKFWKLDGTLLASLNINHPLPITWNLTPNNSNTYHKKVLYALKVVETIFKRNSKTLFIPEAKKISVNLFIKNFQSLNQNNMNHLPSETAPRTTSRIQRRPMVMADAFTARDLQFDKAKIIYKRELQGPTLRQLALLQRINQSEKSSNDFVLREQDNEKIEQQYLKVAEEEREKGEFMTFLLGDLRKDLMKDSSYSEKTKILARKLENLPAKKTVDRDAEKVYAPNRRRDSFTFITSLMGKGNAQDASRKQNDESGSGNLDAAAKSTSKNRVSIPKLKGFPEGLKLQKVEVVSPQDQDEFRSKTQRMRNSSISIRNFKTQRSSSTPKTDFFSYAQEKLLLEENQLEKKTSRITCEVDTPTSQYSALSMKKANKFKFGRILNKLEENLKKSQNSSVPRSMRPSDLQLDPLTLASTQPTSRILTVKNSEPAETQIDADTTATQSQYDQFALKVTLNPKNHLRTMSLPGLREASSNFIKHIDDAQRKLGEQWNIPQSDLMVKKAISKHMMSKMLPSRQQQQQQQQLYQQQMMMMLGNKNQPLYLMESPLLTSPKNPY